MGYELKECTGRAVIESLAGVYGQIYVPPGKDGEEQYRAIVNRGEDPKVKDLSHFNSDERDSLSYERTPEGEVLVITLFDRKDFETLLQIMSNRCNPVQIPKTQGAVNLNGVINRARIRAHEEEYIRQEAEKGNNDPDLEAEFKRFTSVKSNYLDSLIILSAGPYSNVPADKAGFSKVEWLKISVKIRKYHECTHFFCRRRYPEKKDEIWDELAADAIGIYGALGRYDRKLEELFLGIKDGHYDHGRLENYVEAGSEKEKNEELERLSLKISKVLSEFEKLFIDSPAAGIFDMVVRLEEKKEQLWD